MYSSDAREREEQVKNDLADATITKGKRPSVETSMHNAIDYPYVVHLHPTAVNGLMCARNAQTDLRKLFGEKALYVEYTDPGYVLFKKVDDKIKAHRTKFNEEPKVIWLQNHGIFVAGNSIAEIKNTYDEILASLNVFSVNLPLVEAGLHSSEELKEVEMLPAIRMMVSNDGLKTLKVRKNELIQYYSESIENQKDIAQPFTPDAIVYCKSNYIFINGKTTEAILDEADKKNPEIRSYVLQVVDVIFAGLETIVAE